MDYQKAIEVINNHERYVGVKYVNSVEEAYVTPYFEKALDTAISAMQELQEYRKLGTLEEVREAMEKQKKKKPNGDLHSVPHYRCPNCNSTVKLYQNSKKDEICKWCGQRIEWSEVENEQ